MKPLKEERNGTQSQFTRFASERGEGGGALTPQAIEHLLREAVRRKAVDELFAAADRMAAANIPPMTMQEIQAEVDAVRKARHERARRS